MRATLTLYRDYRHVTICFDDNVVPARVEVREFSRLKSKFPGDTIFENELVCKLLNDEDVVCVEVLEQWEINVRYVNFDFDHEPSMNEVKNNLTAALQNFVAHCGETIEAYFDESFEIVSADEFSAQKLEKLQEELVEEETLEEIRCYEQGIEPKPGSNVEDIVNSRDR